MKSILSTLVFLLFSVFCSGGFCQGTSIDPMYTWSENNMPSTTSQSSVNDIQTAAEWFPNIASPYRVSSGHDRIVITLPETTLKFRWDNPFYRYSINFGDQDIGNDNQFAIKRILVCWVAMAAPDAVIPRPDPFIPGSSVAGTFLNPKYDGEAWDAMELSPSSIDYNSLMGTHVHTYTVPAKTIKLHGGINAPWDDMGYDATWGNYATRVVLAVWFDKEGDQDPYFHNYYDAYGNLVASTPIRDASFLPVDLCHKINQAYPPKPDWKCWDHRWSDCLAATFRVNPLWWGF